MSFPQDNKSTHLPEVSGNTVAVTGSLEVDTGLKSVQMAVASLAEDAVAGIAGGISASIEPSARVAGAPIQATIKVWSDTGALSSTELQVSWLAVGK